MRCYGAGALLQLILLVASGPWFGVRFWELLAPIDFIFVKMDWVGST